MVWSSKSTLAFIKCYRNEPIIWDSKHSLHKNKDEVNAAWSRLSKLLYRPVHELKKKEESIMSTFRDYMNEKRESVKRGEDFQPNWCAFKPMEDFLAGNVINTEGSDDYEVIETEMDVNTNENVAATSTERSRRNTERSQMDADERSDRDICAIYGELLTCKLRSFDEITREMVMNEIDSLLFNVKMFQNQRVNKPFLFDSNSTLAKPTANIRTFVNTHTKEPKMIFHDFL